jgi:N-methylhydantoinase A
MSIQRLLDMRYLGQWRSLTVTIGSPADLDEAATHFHSEHERAYNYRRDGAPVEIYRLSVRALGVTPKPELKRHARGEGVLESHATRRVRFDETDAPVDTPVYLRSELPAGAAVEGPAVFEQLDSTTLVPPGWRAEVDDLLNIRMHAEAKG